MNILLVSAGYNFSKIIGKKHFKSGYIQPIATLNQKVMSNSNISSTDKRLKVFSGSSNPELVTQICKHLNIEQGDIRILKFADGEIGVEILETIRGSDVFIVQSICTPVNDHLVELLLMIDAARRASAKRITAVTPYYGYARQDRKTKPRVPISAALVAELIEAAGADRVLALDLHCGQIQGFFRIPVDNLYGRVSLVECFMSQVRDLQNICVVSPDAGGVERAHGFRTQLKKEGIQAKFAVMNKYREEPQKIAKMELVGDVQGCDAIIVDDMIDTGGTLCAAAKVLKDHGARRVYAAATHALLNRDALKKITSSVIEKVIVTNTVPVGEKKKSCDKIIEISCAKLLAQAIKRVHDEESISCLFE